VQIRQRGNKTPGSHLPVPELLGTRRLSCHAGLCRSCILSVAFRILLQWFTPHPGFISRESRTSRQVDRVKRAPGPFQNYMSLSSKCPAVLDGHGRSSRRPEPHPHFTLEARLREVPGCRHSPFTRTSVTDEATIYGSSSVAFGPS